MTDTDALGASLQKNRLSRRQALWLLGLSMGVGAMTGAWIGSHFATRFGARMIRPLLVIVSIGLTMRLIWGWFGYADLFPVNGFMMHLMPSEFGVASLTSGTAAAAEIHMRRVKSVSSWLGSSEGSIGSSAIPQIGQAPG